MGGLFVVATLGESLSHGGKERLGRLEFALVWNGVWFGPCSYSVPWDEKSNNCDTATLFGAIRSCLLCPI